ncbi:MULTISPECIES: IucA/IucC family protein [Legionella]|uniref:FrgA protein n=1 Tax=Legionella drozanskii LLAP-1 TaxID=1212489 RepID=A0A0W0SXI7_9GAMM|nr:MULTISPECIES: IucA/IucC family protein [Legionella]KTC87981.1 FrgA protein [Legionella drozanskii LLAP-1]PJE07309.1 MAG: IucA/IucC family siderophore biosynthesis protein [Legionella sp.]
MALAYGGFQGLNHQLRFLLFELGIALPQNSIDSFISGAHRQCLQQLQQSVVIEGLSDVLIPSHHVDDFLAQLQHQLKQENSASLFFNWQFLHEEMEAAIANEAMAQAYRQRWQMELKRQIGAERSFWEWLCKVKNAQESLELLEQWGCIGFTSSGFQAKLGFSRREVLQYSAEFNAQTSLHWCAIDKQVANTFSVDLTYQDLIKQQFSKEYKLWQEKLRFIQQNPDNYFPLPVHPWQWRNQIQHSFVSLLDNKQLILLPHHQSVKPSFAISLMMPQAKNACYLNLSLDLEGAPPIASICPYSKELNNLLEKHQHYQKSLFILSKLAGLTVDCDAIPAHQQKKLAIALSKNPNQILQEERQRIVPLAALFANSPISDAPLLLEIIDASQLSPESYFQHYCQKLLEGQLHLLLQYGLALSGDRHSTLVLFYENQPQALLFRELNELAIANQPCYQQPRQDAFSAIATRELDEVCQQFIQTNLQNNLSHWIRCLSQYYDLEPLKLWQMVASTIKNNFERLAPGLPSEVLARQYKQLMSQPWEHICFLSMKLQRKKQKIHQLIPNLLNEN